jgi:hypothetical protein
VDNSKLKEQKNPAYEIDPARDQIMVNITHLNSTIKNTTLPTTITLTKINVYKMDSGILSLVVRSLPYIDGGSTSAPLW